MLVFSFYDNNIDNTILTYVNHIVLFVMGCRFITTVHLNVITSIIIYILKLSSTNEV